MLIPANENGKSREKDGLFYYNMYIFITQDFCLFVFVLFSHYPFVHPFKRIIHLILGFLCLSLVVAYFGAQKTKKSQTCFTLKTDEQT